MVDLGPNATPADYQKYVNDVAHGVLNGGSNTPAQTSDTINLRNYAQQLLAERNARRPGMVNGVATGPQAEALGLQREAALGTAPSQAEQLMRKGIDEGIGAQLGTATTLQSSNPGAALRAGLTGASNVVAQNAAAAAAMRADEMAKARDAYAATGNTQAAQEIQARLAQQGLNNQMTLGQDQTVLSALTAPLSTDLAEKQLQNQKDAANQAFLGGLIGTGGSLLAKSDETTKRDIHPAKPAADAFLESLQPKSFEYKAPDGVNTQPGQHLGVIAQDMLGGTTTGPDGKKWISADVIGRVLAGMGRLNERLDTVEGRRG